MKKLMVILLTILVTVLFGYKGFTCDDELQPMPDPYLGDPGGTTNKNDVVQALPEEYKKDPVIKMTLEDGGYVMIALLYTLNEERNIKTQFIGDYTFNSNLIILRYDEFDQVRYILRILFNGRMNLQNIIQNLNKTNWNGNSEGEIKDIKEGVGPFFIFRDYILPEEEWTPPNMN